MGSGSGRFAYHFIRELRIKLEESAHPAMAFRYVMTDVAHSNIEAWMRHPKLGALVVDGILDFAHFDASTPAPFRTRVNEHLYLPGSCKPPVVVLANYTLDSLPTDAFLAAEGTLFERRISILSSTEDLALQDVHDLDQLRWMEERGPADLPCYGDALRDSIVASYLEHPEPISFFFPTAAIDTMEFLASLSSGRMLLFAADKGFVHPHQMDGDVSLDLVPHGGVFSLMVNFHALGSFFTGRGGSMFTSGQRETNLTTALCTEGYGSSAIPRTIDAYRRNFVDFTPYDYMHLAKLTWESLPLISHRHFLSLLRLSNYDPTLVLRYQAAVIHKAESIESPLREDLLDALNTAWNRHYLVQGDPNDLHFVMGVIFQAMGESNSALNAYHHSITEHGEHATTSFNIALVKRDLGDLAGALDDAQKTLELSPDHKDALRLVNKLSQGAS